MASVMNRLVLLRHGESVWNRENRFTGWTDVALSDTGVAESREAGKCLREGGYVFDLAYSSLLKRAIQTLNIVLEALDLLWIPTEKSWRLNERHYGALQGLNKAETAERFGEAQVRIWRRSYDIRPPALEESDPRYEGNDPRYARLTKDERPLTECLQDTVARFLPYWHGTIGPTIQAGKLVLIAAHGSTLRALVKHLDGISDDAIAALNIPTGIPLVYELDADLKPVRSYYLAEAEKVKAAIEVVVAQGRAVGASR